jgi:uncharacterized protein DUF3108
MQKTMPLPAKLAAAKLAAAKLAAAKLPVAATAAAVLAAGLALAGCGSAASSSPGGPSATSGTSGGTPAGASASVPYPVAVGNTWNYKITTGSENGTTVNTMTAVTPVAAGQQVTMLTTDHVGSVNGSAKETYLFHADGSIGYPLGSFSPGSGVTVTSNGIVWPPASVIASGKPSQSTLNISIKAAGQTLSTTAHVTVQGAGTATVTVPAGTYQTTVVLVTERLQIVGITASIQVKTWLAPDVGPVKELVNTNEGSATSAVADEELLSFTKG